MARGNGRAPQEVDEIEVFEPVSDIDSEDEGQSKSKSKSTKMTKKPSPQEETKKPAALKSPGKHGSKRATNAKLDSPSSGSEDSASFDCGDDESKQDDKEKVATKELPEFGKEVEKIGVDGPDEEEHSGVDGPDEEDLPEVTTEDDAKARFHWRISQCDGVELNYLNDVYKPDSPDPGFPELGSLRSKWGKRAKKVNDELRVGEKGPNPDYVFSGQFRNCKMFEAAQNAACYCYDFISWSKTHIWPHIPKLDLTISAYMLHCTKITSIEESKFELAVVELILELHRNDDCSFGNVFCKLVEELEFIKREVDYKKEDGLKTLLLLVFVAYSPVIDVEYPQKAVQWFLGIFYKRTDWIRPLRYLGVLLFGCSENIEVELLSVTSKCVGNFRHFGNAFLGVTKCARPSLKICGPLQACCTLFWCAFMMANFTRRRSDLSEKEKSVEHYKILKDYMVALAPEKTITAFLDTMLYPYALQEFVHSKMEKLEFRKEYFKKPKAKSAERHSKDATSAEDDFEEESDNKVDVAGNTSRAVSFAKRRTTPPASKAAKSAASHHKVAQDVGINASFELGGVQRTLHEHLSFLQEQVTTAKKVHVQVKKIVAKIEEDAKKIVKEKSEQLVKNVLDKYVEDAKIDIQNVAEVAKRDFVSFASEQKQRAAGTPEVASNPQEKLSVKKKRKLSAISADRKRPSMEPARRKSSPVYIKRPKAKNLHLGNLSD